MDSKFGFPASPGTPLFAVSPERANRQPIPPSPSLPSDLAHVRDTFGAAHSRTSSDVQGKVAQFNNLSKEAVQRRKDNEAAIKRAVMGREEAESETRRLKEENRVLRREIEEGRGRERKVAERVEVVMSQLQQSKETHAHAQTLYDKEVRRARKEAFKSSSALVRLQEELKSARNKFTLMREEVDVQRRKVESREQETFTAQYQLVGLQEEIEKIGQQRKITEEERDALKKSLKEEEVARIAAEGRIALPTSREGDEFSSPKKRNLAKRDSLKENIDPKVPDEYASMVEMQDQLALEKRMRQKAEDQIHFLKMECQFRCCSCRIAEREGTEYHYDGSPAHEPEPKASNMNITYSNPGFDHMADPFFDPVSTPSRGLTPLEDSEPLIKFSPTSGTFYKTPSPPKTTNPKPYSPSHSPEHILTAPPTSSAPPPNPQLSTPFHRPFPPLRSATAGQTHTVKTTTVTIPLATTPVPISVPFSPGSTMTREEALEQIRMRRGRARSIAAGNGTPRRAMVQGLERRDISAPAGRV